MRQSGLAAESMETRLFQKFSENFSLQRRYAGGKKKRNFQETVFFAV